MNVMETLMERMSKYTEKLQEAVEERSAEVVKEKKKCDELLSKMLPRYIYIITSSTLHAPLFYNHLICIIENM